MSNEPSSSPAPLRLKPRLRPAEGAIPEAPVEAPVAPVVLEEAPLDPRARLRPRLSPPSAEASAPGTRPLVAPPPAVPATSPAAATPTPADKPFVPPLFITDPAPSAPAAPAAGDPGAVLIGDPGKFRLKPKAPAATTGGASTPPIPPLFLPDDAPPSVPGSVTGQSFTAPGGSTPAFALPGQSGTVGRAGRTLPPFPVPHVKMKAPEPVPEPELTVPVGGGARVGWKKPLFVLLGVAAIVAGIVAGWPHLPAEIAIAGYTVRTKPGFSVSKGSAATAAPAPTPSETLNKLAHLPGNAIDKAQEALAARRASGQDRVDAAARGDDAPATASNAAKPADTVARPVPSGTAVSTHAPGGTVPPAVVAAPEAGPELKAFVTHARISGIFQGNPPRAVINGKLTRAGEVVDEGFGIVFDGLDGDRKNLVFKDRTGASVTRRF